MLEGPSPLRTYQFLIHVSSWQVRNEHLETSQYSCGSKHARTTFPVTFTRISHQFASHHSPRSDLFENPTLPSWIRYGTTFLLNKNGGSKKQLNYIELKRTLYIRHLYVEDPMYMESAYKEAHIGYMHAWDKTIVTCAQPLRSG